MNCVSHCSAHGCTAHASSEKLCDCDVHCRNHNDCCTETRSLDTLSSADLCNATHKQHHRHVAKAASSPASPKQTPCTRSTPYFHSQYARDQTLWRRQRRFLYYCADWGERNFAKYVKGGLPSAFIASILTERALILASCNRDQLDDEARGTDAYLADYVTSLIHQSARSHADLFQPSGFFHKPMLMLTSFAASRCISLPPSLRAEASAGRQTSRTSTIPAPLSPCTQAARARATSTVRLTGIACSITRMCPTRLSFYSTRMSTAGRTSW